MDILEFFMYYVSFFTFKVGIDRLILLANDNQ